MILAQAVHEKSTRAPATSAPLTDEIVATELADAGHATVNCTVAATLASVEEVNVTRPTAGAPKVSQGQSTGILAGRGRLSDVGAAPGRAVEGGRRITAPPQRVAVATMAPTPALSHVRESVEPPASAARAGLGASTSPRIAKGGEKPMIAGRRSSATPSDHADEVEVSAQSAASSASMLWVPPAEDQTARSNALATGHPAFSVERVGTAQEASVSAGPAREKSVRSGPKASTGSTMPQGMRSEAEGGVVFDGESTA